MKTLQERRNCEQKTLDGVLNLLESYEATPKFSTEKGLNALKEKIRETEGKLVDYHHKIQLCENMIAVDTGTEKDPLQDDVEIDDTLSMIEGATTGPARSESESWRGAADSFKCSVEGVGRDAQSRRVPVQRMRFEENVSKP